MGWWPLHLRSQTVPAPPSETCRRCLPLARNKNPPVSAPVFSLLPWLWGLHKPGAFSSAAGDMGECWAWHTWAGPVSKDLVLWGCLHQPAKGRGAAPTSSRFGPRGQCEPKVNRAPRREDGSSPVRSAIGLVGVSHWKLLD